MMKRNQVSTNQLESFKSGMMDYHVFKNLVREQQWEILTHYEKELKAKEIAEMWGITTGTLYSNKYQIKKELGLEQRPYKKSPEKKKDKEVDTQPVEKEKEKKKEEVKKDEDDEVNTEVVRVVEKVVEKPVGLTVDDLIKLMEAQEKHSLAALEGNNGYKFNGEFTSEQLTKKLKKAMALIEDEPIKYRVRFELVEVEDVEEQEKETEGKSQWDDEAKSSLEAFKEGYKALESEQHGLHHPKSEFQSEDKYSGLRYEGGKTKYQTFYICSECNDKGKLFLENGTIYAICSKCGKRMRTRPAVKDGLLETDAFGNYFIAGKFKRADEIEKTKSLHELWA